MRKTWQGLSMALIILTLGLGIASGARAQTAGMTTIHGEVVCFGCALKKEQGAKAQCSIYGHVNAIRLADGKIWSILQNNQSKELVNNHDYAGKHVHIEGRQIPDAQTIEVESFEVMSEVMLSEIQKNPSKN